MQSCRLLSFDDPGFSKADCVAHLPTSEALEWRCLIDKARSSATLSLQERKSNGLLRNKAHLEHGRIIRQQYAEVTQLYDSKEVCLRELLATYDERRCWKETPLMTFSFTSSSNCTKSSLAYDFQELSELPLDMSIVKR